MNRDEQTTKLEEQIAGQTASGREALRVWYDVLQRQTGQQRIEKAFQLTEQIRQIMRAGIRSRHPDATEDEIQHLYVNRLLASHGTSLEEIRIKQKEQQDQ